MQNLPTEPSDRFATRAAHDRLDALFAFPHDPYRQDWEIELSDGSRLEEFFIAYESQELTEDERFALMALVVASAHDALDFHNLTDGQWQIVHELLVRDSHIHTFTHRLYTTGAVLMPRLSTSALHLPDACATYGTLPFPATHKCHQCQ